MRMMRALALRSANPGDLGPAQVPIPEAGSQELLVRVRAIGVGIHDGYFLPQDLRFPYPIGIEAAGTIEAKGSSVTRYQVGQAIAFISSMQPKGGTWAEYAVVDESSLIVPIPEGMSFNEAAALPVAGNTVLRAFHALQLEPKQSLFIAGASGAIGSLAIQLAAERGAVVAGSASERNHAYLRSLGATKAVDYRDPGWVEQLRAWMPDGVDAALGIQPGTPAQCMGALKDGGRLVIVSGDQVTPERGIRAMQIPYQLDVRDELSTLMRRVVGGEIRLVIEQVYPFDRALEALQKTQTRRARGKLVIEIA